MRNALHKIVRRSQGVAAFTLVELMVVIGLMAMLGTISVGGYFAAVRGMTDRGAKQDTVSLIRLAMQTALIDQRPTAVLFYNRRTQDEDTTTGEDTGAEIVGMAVAIKTAGRITLIEDNTLVDEFADWNQSYPMSKENTSDVGMRFYRMTDLDKVENGIEACSSLMNPWVSPVHDNLDEEWMAAAKTKVNVWTSNFKKTGGANQAFSGTVSSENGNNVRWGFKFKEQGQASWQVGDAYGVEIASLQLPKGYIFGDHAPNSTKIEPVKSLSFNPADVTSVSAYDFKLNNTVKISAYRPKGLVQVDTITASDLKDD